MDAQQKKEIDALQKMFDSFQENLKTALQDLSIQEALMAMLFLVVKGVFLSAPNDIEAIKVINQIIVRAKKMAAQNKEEYDREKN